MQTVPTVQGRVKRNKWAFLLPLLPPWGRKIFYKISEAVFTYVSVPFPQPVPHRDIESPWLAQAKSWHFPWTWACYFSKKKKKERKKERQTNKLRVGKNKDWSVICNRNDAAICGSDGRAKLTFFEGPPVSSTKLQNLYGLGEKTTNLVSKKWYSCSILHLFCLI